MEDFLELACRRCFEETVVNRRRLAMTCRIFQWINCEGGDEVTICLTHNTIFYEIGKILGYGSFTQDYSCQRQPDSDCFQK